MNKHLLTAMILLPFSANAEPLFKKGPKLSPDRGWEDMTIHLNGDVLEIKTKGESIADGGIMDGYSYRDACEYRKK